MYGNTFIHNGRRYSKRIEWVDKQRPEQLCGQVQPCPPFHRREPSQHRESRQGQGLCHSARWTHSHYQRKKPRQTLIETFLGLQADVSVSPQVLIANNGIAAVKEIRSVRKWAYETFGDERAIQFTVMATPEDLQANAEYIRMADQYVEVSTYSETRAQWF